ncbi:MAG: GDP-mannose 4,6-dehydratase [Mariniphaga sp.]|nr:GDP-mannose 4,6-dehydratase [Mariniphaga sp.]
MEKKVRKKALITCVVRQDGSHLAELLFIKGYEVQGINRRSGSINTGRIDRLINDKLLEERFNYYYGDLTDIRTND